MMQRKTSYVLYFILGFVVLAVGSTLQKMLIGATITVNGYLIPLVYGGAAGLGFGYFVRKNQMLVHSLRQRNSVVLKEHKENIELSKQLKQNLKLLEEQKQKAQASVKLQHAFLRNLNHEIRTPLNGILGFAQILKQTKHTDILDYVSVINENGERLLFMVENIIAASEIDSGSLQGFNENVELHELVRNVLAKYKNVRNKPDVDFVLKNNKLENTLLHGDKHLFSLIFTNLLDNAFENTNKGAVTISFDVQKNDLLVKIIDTGIGIDPKYQRQVFDAFFQSPPSVGDIATGMGLGLSVAKNIINQYDGTVYLKSELGVGTEFTVTLPIVVRR